MIASVRNVQIPLPEKYADLRVTFDTLLRYLDQFDLRSTANAMAGGALFDGTRLTIGDAAKVASQRTLPTVAIGSRISVQSSQPLTALSGTTRIDIAAHTVQYGFGAVAYNSGAIVGLAADTLYYVYADDPDLDGGAVSYFAATSPQTVAAAQGRYFVGSIKTPAAADVAGIAGATKAYPCVITLDAPVSWTTGNLVTIAGLVSMTELNGSTYTVTRYSSTQFYLNGINSSTFTAFAGPLDGTATRNATNQAGSGGATAGGGGSTVFLGSGF